MGIAFLKPTNSIQYVLMMEHFYLQQLIFSHFVLIVILDRNFNSTFFTRVSRFNSKIKHAQLIYFPNFWNFKIEKLITADKEKR